MQGWAAERARAAERTAHQLQQQEELAALRAQLFKVQEESSEAARKVRIRAVLGLEGSRSCLHSMLMPARG